LSAVGGFSQTRLGRFLSVSFNQPLGQRIEPEGVGGYYVDMRVKARTPTWPTPDFGALDRTMKVAIAQWGLGAFEHWLETGSEEWLAAARSAADHFVSTQVRDGPLAGGWPHVQSFPHSYELPAGWLSGMAQGEAASLLVRVHAETGDDARAGAAQRADRRRRRAGLAGRRALVRGVPDRARVDGAQRGDLRDLGRARRGGGARRP
jgi:hypothetical protein